MAPKRTFLTIPGQRLAADEWAAGLVVNVRSVRQLLSASTVPVRLKRQRPDGTWVAWLSSGEEILVQED